MTLDFPLPFGPTTEEKDCGRWAAEARARARKRPRRQLKHRITQGCTLNQRFNCEIYPTQVTRRKSTRPRPKTGQRKSQGIISWCAANRSPALQARAG